MLQVKRSTQFKRDYKKCKRRGKDMDKMRALVDLLATRAKLPAKYEDHALIGNWNRHREAHIEGDWVLVYKVSNDVLHLTRTGKHNDFLQK